MACQRNMMLSAVLIGVLGGGIILISNVPQSGSNHALTYKQFVPVADPERRCESLGPEVHDKLVDMSAFAGMPNSYSEVVSKYFESIFSAIKAFPMTRRRYYHQAGVRDDSPYPDGAHPIVDRDAIVSPLILPRPDAIRRWSSSTEAHSLGWRTEDDAARNRGSVYGRTVIFDPGKRSENPNSLPASPFETDIHSWDLYTPDQDGSFFLDLGKLVVTPLYEVTNGTLKDRSAGLRLGEKGGAELLGELVTVPAYLKNGRLRWVCIRKGLVVRQFLAYSLLDGNGLKRGWRFEKSTTAYGPISPYVRPLICDLHQPKIKQHDELLLPTPLGWPPADRERRATKLEQNAHEEWCLDDWFPAQKDACWVIREAEDSKPLQESFLLMPASEKSNRPVFFIALFAETEPKQLVKELASLYNVSPDVALDSPEAMEKLNSLYEKVRDFPLGK